MPSVCLYFQVHQPRRLRRMTFFEVGAHPPYFDDTANRRICQKVAQKCYIPANRLLLKLLEDNPDFCLSFSLSGTVLEQLRLYAPDALASFQALVRTGRVELLGETYYHSLASLFDPTEFRSQVRLHSTSIKKIFGVSPTVFRNTELIYSNDIGRMVKALGFTGMLTEGVDRILNGRSPHATYRHPRVNLPLLLKDYRRSDHIAFRFVEDGQPLGAASFMQDIAGTSGQSVNLFMDYETFGEHQWAETGIFTFLEGLPAAARRQGVPFLTPSQTIASYKTAMKLDVPEPISWADQERDLSAWLGNPLQDSLIAWVYQLGEQASACGGTHLATWRELQTSDHFYYLCTKHWEDGNVHKYFSPFDSPHQAYTVLNNVLADFSALLKDNLKTTRKVLQTKPVKVMMYK